MCLFYSALLVKKFNVDCNRFKTFELSKLVEDEEDMKNAKQLLLENEGKLLNNIDDVPEENFWFTPQYDDVCSSIQTSLSEPKKIKASPKTDFKFVFFSFDEDLKEVKWDG